MQDAALETKFDVATDYDTYDGKYYFCRPLEDTKYGTFSYNVKGEHIVGCMSVAKIFYQFVSIKILFWVNIL